MPSSCRGCQGLVPVAHREAPQWTRWPHQLAASQLGLSWNHTVALVASRLLPPHLVNLSPLPFLPAEGPTEKTGHLLDSSPLKHLFPPRGQRSASHPLLCTPNCFIHGLGISSFSQFWNTKDVHRNNSNICVIQLRSTSHLQSSAGRNETHRKPRVF